MLPGFCPLGPEVSGPRHFGVESVHRAHSWQQVGTLVFRLAILGYWSISTISIPRGWGGTAGEQAYHH